MISEAPAEGLIHGDHAHNQQTESTNYFKGRNPRADRSA
jgi:hypothetical protein